MTSPFANKSDASAALSTSSQRPGLGTRSDFNKLFQKARQGAERVVVRTLQQQQVSSGCEMGVYAKITGAFIAWDVFSNHFKQPPDSITNIPIIKIAHPFLSGSSEDTWVT